MANERVNLKIRGISPLLMHRFPLEPVQAIDKKSKEEQAEIAAYRDEDTGELYIPGVAIQRALIAAATYSKGKGRASLQKPVAACVFVDPDQCGLGTKTYKIDARAVVVPATKGRIVRYRPRLDVDESGRCRAEDQGQWGSSNYGNQGGWVVEFLQLRVFAGVFL